MTPEEIALRIVRQYALGNSSHDWPLLQSIIAKQLEQAIAEEREACAKVADDHGYKCYSGYQTAYEIRARNASGERGVDETT